MDGDVHHEEPEKMMSDEPRFGEGERLSLVVVGTTLAPGSERVVEAGAAFARALGTPALLVHVQSPRIGPAQAEENERRLRSQADRLGPRSATNWELLRALEPWRVLLAATPSKSGVLVVAAHESDGVLGIRLGGSTAHLLRRAHCALLVVRGLGPFPLAAPRVPGHAKAKPSSDAGQALDLRDLAPGLLVESLPSRGGLLGPWRRWRVVRRVVRLSESALLIPEGDHPENVPRELASTA